MIQINLIPKELRKKKKVPFFDMYFLYVFAILVLIGIALWLQTTAQQREIAKLDDELARVEAEIQKYNQQIKKVEEARALRDKILARMAAIQDLDIQRPLAVKMLEDFSMLIPEFVWIESFMEIERVLTLTGKSYNLKGIANLIVGLIGSEYFDQIKLNYIRDESKSDNVSTFIFEMSSNVVFESAETYAGEFSSPTIERIPDQNRQETRRPSSIIDKGKEALSLDPDLAKESVQGLGN